MADKADRLLDTDLRRNAANLPIRFLRAEDPRYDVAICFIRFEVPKGPMPFEQTTRETIPESVRATVWRRDGGACVQCDSKEHLQFDHIIPVSKGGATSTVNLQLLCRACNLKKTNVI